MIMSKNVYLVSCVSKKMPVAAPARELYISDWFLKASAYAQENADIWFILSAKYGLLSNDRMIDPYNVTLNIMSASDRRNWANQVLTELRAILQPGDRVIFLAGKTYREHLMVPLLSLGCFVEVPMEGLTIGRQLSWLKKRTGIANG